MKSENPDGESFRVFYYRFKSSNAKSPPSQATQLCATAYSRTGIRRLVRLKAGLYCLLAKTQSLKLVSMNTFPSEPPMATTRKIGKPDKKLVRDELTFLDVRQAARDGQKAFDKFVITGKLPITK
ncbi:hypothetical protein [Pseudomonas sp. 31-12]|uniref:hypothetical protein n=1 Tax=Pseudomonas sp. 31-12 TaxID=2201356 RepID=UPI0013A5A8DF|nr:hypothetical protein [Pseudomonas sp. 31-12]